MLVLKRKGDAGSVNHLAFTPDGSRILTGAPGGSVNCWTAGGDHVWGKSTEYGVYGLAVTSGGESVFAGGGQLGVFRTADGAAVAPPVDDRYVALATGSGGRAVFALTTASAQDGRLVGGTYPGGDWPRWTVNVARWVSALAFLPGGERFVTDESDLFVRSADTGAVACRLSCPDYRAEQVTATAEWVAARAGANVFVWGLADPDSPPVRLTTGSRKHFTGIAFHPSGRHLAATCNDKSARVYAVGSWAVARTFDWKIGRLRSVAFSPDGTLAAAGGDKGQTVIWDFDA